MYAIYAYIRVVWGVNVGIYGIHGVFGYIYARTGLLGECEKFCATDEGLSTL